MKLPAELHEQYDKTPIFHSEQIKAERALIESVVRDCAKVCVNMAQARSHNGLENALRVEDKRCADAILYRYGLIDEIHESPTDNPRQVIPHRSGGGRPECVFNYCMYPDNCKAIDGCMHPGRVK